MAFSSPNVMCLPWLAEATGVVEDLVGRDLRRPVRVSSPETQVISEASPGLTVGGFGVRRTEALCLGRQGQLRS